MIKKPDRPLPRTSILGRGFLLVLLTFPIKSLVGAGRAYILEV